MSDAVTEVAVEARPLSAEQQAWVERAWAEIDDDRMGRLLAGMVDIPSPTGEERPLAEYVAAYLRAAGLEGRAQLIDEQQANAVGRLRGAGTGPDLLLFALGASALAVLMILGLMLLVIPVQVYATRHSR